MNYRDYTSRMCSTCHGLRCSPDCPENDEPDDDEIGDPRDEEDADDEWEPPDEDLPEAAYGHPRDCRCVLCEIGDYYGGAE